MGVGRGLKFLVLILEFNERLASFLFGFLQDIYGPHKLFLVSGLVEVGFVLIVLFYLRLIKSSMEQQTIKNSTGV